MARSLGQYTDAPPPAHTRTLRPDAQVGHGAIPRRRAAAIQRRLLRWFASNRRALPWRRRKPQPYQVWLAEIMLQQTRVATAIPYYERFLARFPDIASLAAADEDEVLALWSGLGYYSRARSLRRAARIVAERHAGKLPCERAALEELPGIGRYTAGAILSIAFGREEPVVDGNVRRLLSRLLLRAPVDGKAVRAARAVGGSARRRARSAQPGLGFTDPSPAALEAQARVLVSGAPPAKINQALMELGALVCRPSSPSCPLCPLSRICTARRLGVQERVPSPRRRPPVIRQSRAVALIRRRGQILLERADVPGAPRGLWDLPGTLVPPGAEPGSYLERHLCSRGLEARIGGRLASVRHGITFRRIDCTAYEATLQASLLGEARAPENARRRWVESARLAALPIGSATRRLLADCLRSA